MKSLMTLIVFMGLHALATESASKKAAPTSASQTNHSFEDLLVQGQYHFSDEAVSTVEEDKVLDSLLGLRSDFKDRMKKTAEQF